MSLQPLPYVYPDAPTAYRRIGETVNAVTAAQRWTAPSLVNGWVAFGAPYNTPGYYQDVSGRVYCRGVIKSGTVTDPTTLFTLPYAPVNEIIAIAQAFSGSAISPVRLDVDSSGNVILHNAASFSGSYWVSLDQLHFQVAP